MILRRRLMMAVAVVVFVGRLVSVALADDAKQSKKWWDEDPEAERQGFGVILHKTGTDWVVYHTLKGSPADEAGVKPGDVIEAIDGKAVRSLAAPKLNATIELLDTRKHNVAFVRDGKTVSTTMQPRVLRELFEADAGRGGEGARASCYSCPSCYSRTSGAKSCADCPTYGCTTG